MSKIYRIYNRHPEIPPYRQCYRRYTRESDVTKFIRTYVARRAREQWEVMVMRVTRTWSIGVDEVEDVGRCTAAQWLAGDRPR